MYGLKTIVQKGEKVLYVAESTKDLTYGKAYDVVYSGGNHSIINDDNGNNIKLFDIKDHAEFKSLREYIAGSEALDVLLFHNKIAIDTERDYAVKWTTDRRAYDADEMKIMRLAKRNNLRADGCGIYLIDPIEALEVLDEIKHVEAVQKIYAKAVDETMSKVIARWND